MQTFASRQAYTFIKGQYVPIILDNVSDESQMTMDARKYYVQNYDFTMLGYLIDEDEFEVKPAIQRITQLFEIDTTTRRQKVDKYPKNPDEFDTNFLFVIGNSVLVDMIDYTANMSLVGSDNVDTYDIYINDDYYGSDVATIQITTNDVLRIEITKLDSLLQSNITFNCKLV